MPYYSTDAVIEMTNSFQDKWILSSKDYDDNNQNRPIDKLKAFMHTSPIMVSLLHQLTTDKDMENRTKCLALFSVLSINKVNQMILDKADAIKVLINMLVQVQSPSNTFT